MSDLLWWLCAFNGVGTGLYLFWKLLARRVIDVVSGERVYYPYEYVDPLTHKEHRGVFTVRKPMNALEWAFLGSFVMATGSILYKLHNSDVEKLKPEAQKKIVDKYKRFARMSMFATLFPLACYNSTNEILYFCKYVSEYYKTCMGLTDFFADATTIIDDITSPESATNIPTTTPTPQGGSAARFRGCHHSNTCAVESSTEPCHTSCGGHYCHHDLGCVPTDDLEQKHDTFPQSKDSDVELKDPVFHYASDSDDEVLNDGVPDPQPTGRWAYWPIRSGYFVTSSVSSNENWLNRQINKFRGTDSERKHEEIMKQRAEAEERLRRGETHYGLGYKPHRPDSVWRALMKRFSTWTTKFISFYEAVRTSMFYWYARYHWYLIGGASILGAASLIYVCNRLFRSRTTTEGGKKRNRGGKKEKADRSAARAAVSTVSDVLHTISKGQNRDLQRAQRDREWEEERQRQAREMLDEYERTWGQESLVHDNVKYSDMDRKQLLKELNRIKSTWSDKKDLKEKRARFSAVMSMLNLKYPKPDAQDQTKKVVAEHLQKNSLPFHTPKQFVAKCTRNGVPVYVTVFGFANSVYIPRHGVCGANEIVILIGGKEVAITAKGVILKNFPDLVQFPAPSGLPMNKNLKFRAPEKGEIVTCFWVRSQDHTRSTQTVGVVGEVSYLGADKKLKVVDYSGSSEDGTCGGLYVAAKDGYVVGIHGLGSTDVTAKPRFYPMTTNWYEDSKDASNQVKNYDPSADTDYYNKQMSMLNGKIAYESLN